MFQRLKKGRARLAGILTVALLGLAIPIGLLATAQAQVATSRATIRWNEQRTFFAGRVTSQLPACRADRVVRVFKVRPGRDKAVGSDVTNRRGLWKVNKRHRVDGRFYARVARAPAPGYYGQANTCGADRSRRILA